jgi:cysteine-rich repeat protein
VVPECGNTIAEGSEECDDGNDDDDDGCRNDCKVDCGRFDGAKEDDATHHCYWVHSGLLDDTSFSGAVDKCQNDGGHLVTVSSDAENAFVRGVHDQDKWIGARDDRGQKDTGAGTYAWITGEPFTYTNWAGGEPNAAKFMCWFDQCYEHCAIQKPDGSWNDWNCDADVDVVCEWDPPGF